MTKTKQKLKAVGKQINKGTDKTMLSFRVDTEIHKQLSQIAQRKKASKTRVISELIRLAYLGLYSKPSKVLNEFYNDVVKAFESKLTIQERKALELKKEVTRSQRDFIKRNPKLINELRIKKNK